MRQVYSQEESQDRRQFYNFLLGHFTIANRSSKHLKGALNAEWLHDVYSQLNPNTTLSVADIAHILVTLGAEDPSVLWLNLRRVARDAIPMSILKSLHVHVKTDVLHELTATRLADTTSAHAATRGFILFVTRYIRPSNTKFKTNVADIMELYGQYCQEYQYSALGRRMRTKLLEDHCGPVQRGYVNGASGVRYVFASIPDKKDWDLCIRVGLGLFRVGEDTFEDTARKWLHIDPQGQALDLDTELYVANRLRGETHGQKETPQEETQSSAEGPADDYGGDSQSTDAIARSKAEPDNARSSSRRNVTDITDSNSGSTAPNDSAPNPQRTSGGVGNNGTTSGTTLHHPGTFRDDCALNGSRHEREVEEVDDDGYVVVHLDLHDNTMVEIDLDSLDNEELDDDDEELDDEELDEDDEDDLLPPTLDRVFEALKARYLLEAFDKAECAYFLSMIDVPFTADDIWENFLKYIEEGEGNG